MLTILNILSVCLVLLYAATFFLYARHFFKDDDESAFIGTRLLYTTLLLHLSHTIARGIVIDAFPLGQKAEFLSLIALSITGIYSLIEKREDETHTGMFFLGISMIFQLLAAALTEPPGHAALLLANPVYGVHVAFIILGTTGLSVGALWAGMYILLAHQLRNHELGVFFKRLPPLAKLEGMSKRSTITGIFLLAVGLGMGHYIAWNVVDGLNLLDPKIILMDMVLLTYIIGLIVVKLRGLSGRRAGYLSLAGYMLFLLTIVISNVALSSFHSFN